MKASQSLPPGRGLFHGFLILTALTALIPRVQAGPCTPPPPGLVGWWKGDGTGVDTVAGNNGVLVNIGYTNGVNGLAFACDPENYPYIYTGIQIADQPAYALTNSLTIEGWVRPRGDGFIVFWRGDNRPGMDPYYLSMHGDSSNAIDFGITDANGNNALVETTLNYDVWTYVAATLEGGSGTLSIYTNGVVAAQTVTTVRPFGDLIPGDSPGIGIGNVNDGGNNFPFRGDIDEISLYSRALSAGEIQSIYNASNAGKCLMSCTPPPAGLVSWWAGEENLLDSVGTNNGSMIGTVTFTNGEVGQGFYFDGGANGIVVQDASELNYNSNDDLSIDAWIQPLAQPGNDYDIIDILDKRVAPTSNIQLGYDLFLEGGVLSFQMADVLAVDSFNNFSAGPDLRDGNFHHVAVTVQRNSTTGGRFYIDGQLAGTFDPTVCPGDLSNAGPLLIGSHPTSGFHGSYHGIIDELSLYRRALTSNEISAIYMAGSAGKCQPPGSTNNCVTPPSGLVSWWPAEGNANDVTGGNNGITTNITYTIGEVGNAFNFNGSNAYVRVLASSGLNVGTGNGFTFETWINPATLNPQPLAEWNGNTGDSGIGAHFWISEGKYFPGPAGCLYANLVDTGGGDHYFSTGGGVVITNTYQHIALTYDQASGTAVMYCNGIAVQTSNLGGFIPQTSFDFYLGDRSSGSAAGSTFGGAMDEPGLYNRALSAAEIAAIYNAGSAGKCRMAVAPSIVSEPTNLTVTVNDTAVFNVIAEGSAPLIYQWSFNGTNIIGATNASLTLTNVQPAQAGNYSVVISNYVSVVASSNALLTVFVPAIPPAILSQTPNRVVLLGNTATFSVTAGGSEPLSYLWQRDGRLIPGATNASYSLLNAQLSDSGSRFICLVTNAWGSASSTNVSLKVIDTIANDLSSGAILITSASYTNAQSTLKASSFGDPTPDCVDGFGHGVWYQFTAPVAGRLTVDTFGSDFDTGLAIYTGSPDSLTEVACNDDTGGVTSQVIIPATAGMAYFILAGGYGSDAGNLVLHLTYQTPPAFVIQPTNLDVVVTSNANFATALAGTLPIGLQWYFNNTPLVDSRHIGGSQSNILIIARVLTNDAGSYQLVASNIVGVVTSSVAMLTPVILPPVIAQQPVSQSVLAGSNVTFTTTVAGTAPYYYQWAFNGSALTDDGIHVIGSGTNSLTLLNLTAADAGSYSLLVTNISGATNSQAATLTVLIPPGITLNPIGRSVPPGLPTVFNAAASGVPTPTYQWQLNGTNLPGATSSSYTNPAVGTNDLGFYHVVASNSVGITTSADAQLTFGPVAAWGRNLNNECLPPPGLSNVTAIAGCSAASFAVRTDGTIAAWGSGSITNIPPSASNVVLVAVSPGGGVGAAAVRSDGTVVGWSPVLPPITLSNVVSVAVGDFRFGLALRAEGTLIGWGPAPYSTVPAGLNHVTAIACGYTHSLALRDDGTVVAWGSGAATNVPAGLANVSAIAAGYSHSLALKSNGTVVAWGSGSGTNLPAGLTNIMAISASGSSQGQSLSFALRANGRVVAWGDNLYGETNPPAALSNLFPVAIAAAPYHGLALVSDGSPVILHPPVGLTAYTGRDVMLQAAAVGTQPLSYQWLLNGTNLPAATNSNLFIPNVQFGNAGNYQLLVSNSLNTALSVAAPLNAISNSALTFLSQMANQTNYQGGKVTLSATVLGSGPLSYQWYFNPDPSTSKTYTAVSGATNDTLVLDPALAINSGTYYVAVSNHLAGITSTPAFLRVLFARAWGYNAVSNPPVNVTNALALAMSYGLNNANSYFALGANGKLTAWGNSFSQYGETNVAPLSNSFVTAIAAGQQDVLALKSDGTVYAWGFGQYGQTNPPAGLNSVVGIACGAYHDLALKADGTVVGWGANLQFNYGQATNNPAATNVVAIAAAQYRSVALRADGTVVSWGYGADGTGIIPPSATNVIAITAGTAFNAALRADGKVVQWGAGLANYPVPANLSNVVAISGSSQHCTALRNDGTVVSWGLELQNLASNNVPADLANVIAITSGGEQDMALFGTRAPAFTVNPWNRAFPVNAITNILLAAKCAGVQPVRYQWQLNGTNVPNATNDTLILSNNPFATARMNFIQPGAYQLIASNAYGVVASKYAKVTTFYPLADALDTPTITDGKTTAPLYNWTTSGNAQWFGETNITHDGVDAAQSGGIGALQETILQTTVGTNWSGRYTFWWKVSSEQDFDILEFRVNGITQASISGQVDWQFVSIPVATGTNVLQWRYSKDASFDFGQDAGWVDQFAFIPDPPIITVQPVSQTVNMGANVTLQVTAIGPVSYPAGGYGRATLTYQWRQNGNPIGGNTSVLALNNVGRAQNGTYSVTVTNFAIPNNSIVSSNAFLKVLVPQLLGSPVLRPDGSFQLTSADANGGLLQPSDLTNFEAQASTNLSNWVTLPNALSLTNGMLLLQESTHSNYPTRFYRLLEH